MWRLMESERIASVDGVPAPFWSTVEHNQGDDFSTLPNDRRRVAFNV